MNYFKHNTHEEYIAIGDRKGTYDYLQHVGVRLAIYGEVGRLYQEDYSTIYPDMPLSPDTIEKDFTPITRAKFIKVLNQCFD